MVTQGPEQPCHRLERALLVLILLVAAFTRLWHLDLMEFKTDEAQACRLAYRALGDPLLGDNAKIPLVGLTASIGVPNPPLFIYLLVLPLAVSRNPYAAVVFIALCNVAAVWLCYVVGRRYFSPFVGLAAAGLYALSPWAVVFSRKIWAQDLMPVLVCLFLLAAHRFLVDRQSRMAAWLIVLAGAAIQVHFSAVILLGVLVYVLYAGRAAFRWQWFWAGVAISLLLYAPYFCYLAVTHGANFVDLAQRRQQWGAALSGTGRLLLSLRYIFAVSSADATDFLTGIPWRFTLPISLATGAASLTGLAGLCLRDRAGPLLPARLMLLLWFVLPVASLAVLHMMPFPHYFIVLYPIPFLGLAVALGEIGRRWRWCGGVLLGMFLAGYAAFDVAIFRGIEARGGAAADYGIAYTYKVAAMNFVLAENPDRPFIILDDFNTTAKVPLEYQVLLALQMRENHLASAPGNPTRAYVLINTLTVTLSPEVESHVQGLRHQQFGPLTVFVVPLPPNTGERGGRLAS